MIYIYICMYINIYMYICRYLYIYIYTYLHIICIKRDRGQTATLGQRPAQSSPASNYTRVAIPSKGGRDPLKTGSLPH